MKKLVLSFAALLLIAISLGGCTSNTPKAVAEKFLDGLYHYDYESAKSVSTEETKNMLDMMAEFSAKIPESEKKAAKKTKVTIKDVKEEGDHATVTYTLSDDPDEKRIRLVQQDGKWLVQYSKTDYDIDGDLKDEGEPEEPLMENAIPAPPADGTVVDTTQHDN